MNLIKVKILTPKGIYLEKDIYRLDIKTKSGNIGVLHGHIPIVSSIEISKLQIIDKDKKPKEYALHGGLLNVLGKEAIIITSAIEKKEDIDKKRAKIAKLNAEKDLSTCKKNNIETKTAELALKRAIIRLKT